MQKDITQALFYSTLHAFIAFFAFIKISSVSMIISSQIRFRVVLVWVHKLSVSGSNSHHQPCFANCHFLRHLQSPNSQS